MTKRRGNKSKVVLNYDYFVKKISDYEFSLLCSEYYGKLLKQLKLCCAFTDIEEISQILCFGLGHFTECVSSKYQLAVLLLLKRQFNARVQIYDPVFSETELTFLEKLDINYIAENEEGARILEPKTLIFLPHCPNSLLNNLLWRNWDPNISKCIIFGNSFKFLAENQTRSRFKTDYYYIYSIFPHVNEIEIDNCFKYTDIFNDMSLHTFPADVMNNLPKTFWDLGKKVPRHYHTDMDLVTNKLQNIKLEDIRSLTV